jgi:hypothetical protein
VLQKPTVPLSANCSAPMGDNDKENEISVPRSTIRILLADDHTLFREGVARMRLASGVVFRYSRNRI